MEALLNDHSIIAGQLEFYERQAQTELSQAAFTDMAAMLGLGLHVYKVIRRLDDEATTAAQSDHSLANIDDAREFGKLYQRWLDTSRLVLKRFKEGGHAQRKFTDFNEFGDAIHYTASVLSIDLERLYRPVTGGKPAAEVRDGLRRYLQQSRVGVLAHH